MEFAEPVSVQPVAPALDALNRRPFLQVALSHTPEHHAVARANPADDGPGWARREQTEIDGLQYDIWVTVRGHAYVGVWICRDCGVHGMSRGENHTADQASARAQLGLCDHHKSVHRRPRNPK